MQKERNKPQESTSLTGAGHNQSKGSGRQAEQGKKTSETGEEGRRAEIEAGEAWHKTGNRDEVRKGTRKVKKARNKGRGGTGVQED